jgi:hypothetical protein
MIDAIHLPQPRTDLAVGARVMSVSFGVPRPGKIGVIRAISRDGCTFYIEWD